MKGSIVSSEYSGHLAFNLKTNALKVFLNCFSSFQYIGYENTDWIIMYIAFLNEIDFHVNNENYQIIITDQFLETEAEIFMTLNNLLINFPDIINLSIEK